VLKSVVVDEPFRPKVVLGLITKNGNFLLIRREPVSLKVSWAFPGGVNHQGETDEEAVIREVKQEVGLDVEVKEKLLERKHPNTLVPIAYFHCLAKGNQKPKIGEPYEIAEVAWVPAEEVLNKFTSDVDSKIKKFILSFA